MSPIYTLLSHSWSGLVIAAIVALLGLLATRFRRRRLVRWTGLALCGLALLLAAASLFALYHIHRAERSHPPLGRLVDVGGYRLHLLAEGDAKGGPTLVWIPGGHSPGLALHHLHKAMRGETRSILFDRPGTGWSETGPFPVTTPREAEALHRLLANAGEKGPFLLLGHSYGGLLAANYARRYPGQVAAVMLLDPTPPDVFLYLPGGGGPGIPLGLVRAGQITGLMKLFGLWSDPRQEMRKRPDEMPPLLRKIDEALAEVDGAISARQAAPASDWVSASLFSEWFDPRLVAELTVYDGELGDLPVYLVTPQGDTTAAEVRQMGIPDAEVARALRFLQHARQRYLAISSRSEFIRTPDGTGHNFPYEVPDFVLATVRQVLARIRAPQAGSASLSGKEAGLAPAATYFEIPVKDLGRATSFYEKVLGCQFERTVIDGNQMALFPAARGVGGISGALAKGEGYVPGKEGARIYFQTVDIDDTLRKAQLAGGRILYPRTSIGSRGWVAEFEDSEGNCIALHTE
jgi:predicted enzyme related to lactoylglutathione lyase/pimeloyl-ACP methyl ester carboxylesterase